MRPSNRASILDAAFRLADHDQGSIAITFDAVAREAGVTKAGVQYHFHSRRELILAAVEYVAKRVEWAMQQCLSTSLADSSVAERVGAYVEVVAAGRLTRGDLAVYAESIADPGYAAPWASIVERWLDVDEISDPAVRTRVAVARLAADGLWLGQVADVPVRSNEIRASVLTHLRSLTNART